MLIGQSDPASMLPREGDLLVKADTSSLQPLTPIDVPLNAAPDLGVGDGSRRQNGAKRVAAQCLDPAEISSGRLTAQEPTACSGRRRGVHSHLHAQRLRGERLD